MGSCKRVVPAGERGDREPYGSAGYQIPSRQLSLPEHFLENVLQGFFEQESQ